VLHTSIPAFPAASFPSVLPVAAEDPVVDVLLPFPFEAGQASFSPRAAGRFSESGEKREDGNMPLSFPRARPAPGSSTGAGARTFSCSSLRHPF
jgi:hypothetical protein